MVDVDADHLLRLKDEFRTAIDLRYGNLVRLGELIEDDGVWFSTMELVDGDTRALPLVARTAALALCRLDEKDDVVARAAFIAEGVVRPEPLARLFCPPFFAGGRAGE